MDLGVRGFTLIEMLTVVSIIAILAALLFPVLGRAREASRRIACGSNLRQIGGSLQMYVQDYDGEFPNNGDPFLWMGRRWRWVLQPYLAYGARRDPAAPADPNRSVDNRPLILLCPSDSSARQKWDATSYAYSAAFYHSTGQIAAMTTRDLYRPSQFAPVSQGESDVRWPANKAVFGEWLSNHTFPKVGWWSWEGARNYLFVDGHVKYVRARQILPAVNGWPDVNLTVGGLSGKDLP